MLKITKSDVMPKLILYTLLIVISILLGNYIVKNEGKAIRYKSFQRALSLIFMLLLGYYIFGERVNKIHLG